MEAQQASGIPLSVLSHAKGAGKRYFPDYRIQFRMNHF